jgi:cytochrome c biogenesis protein CcdA
MFTLRTGLVARNGRHLRGTAEHKRVSNATTSHSRTQARAATYDVKRKLTHLGSSILVAAGASIVFTIFFAIPAYAATDLTGVIDAIRNWVAGLLAGLATLFLMVGGVRYLTAGGNPRSAEEGKAAIKSALIGYGLAALAPVLVDIMRRVLGT